MQHFLNWATMGSVAIPVAICSKWQVAVIILGVLICSQSLHESRHHPDGWFTDPVFRFLGILIAGIGAWFLR